MKTIRQLIGLFEQEERKQVFFILGLIVLMAVVETLSIISILPFIALLSNPAAIEHSHFLSQAYDYIGRPNMRHFMIFIGMGVLAVLVLSNAINAYTYRAITYFTYIKSDTIARRLLINYMAKPYTFFLNQNTSHLTNIMLNEVAMVVKNVLIPVMNNIARIVVTVFILALLLFVNPGLTLIVLSVLGGSYFAIYMLMQRKLAATGARRVYMSLSIFKTLSETLNAAKEIKILGQERNFVKRFSKPSLEKARCFALHETLGTLPRYFLETVAFGGILVIILYMMIVMNDVQDALPVIALYAFAGQRLMPSMQNIFSNMAKIQSSKASLDLIAGELGSAPLSLPPPAIGHLPLRKAIALKNLSYKYDSSDRDVLNDVSLTIGAGSTVAFVGGTGAGKTTLVDLLLGVLTPDKGVINIDDTFLHDGNMREWQASLGYVPQKIVLFDDSVTRNIACGLPDQEIDMDAVKKAAEIANIDKFILTELPNGYDTMIGENGIRLSGGQRQRLGIARALYRDPDVLVLDEATSALDNLTEEAVIEAVSRLAKRKTIIMIAHRLSTVQGCDVIHMMEHGRIIGSGSYEELLRTCSPFRRMAEGGREQNYMAQA